MPVVTLEDVAIIINPAKDNVAVVTVEFIDQGTVLAHEGGSIKLSGRALRGQSFAVKKIRRKEPYISLGDPIGLASRTVHPGDPIDESNIENRLPKLRVSYRDNPKRAPLDRALSSLTWDGFVRSDGSVGARNYIGIVTSGMCSSTEVREIAARAMRELYSREKYPNVDGIVPIIHESGCGMPDGWAVDLLNQLLGNTLRHPNLGAALYVDLGCGKTCVECSAPVLVNFVPNYQQRVVNLTIQLSGGSVKTVERGLEIVAKMLPHVNEFKRQPVPVSKLIVGTECGGSDRWSGVTANPAVGVASDMFVKAGAAVLLPEIPELQGAAMIDLVRRARSRKVGRKLMGALKRYEKYVSKFGEDFRENPSPGNKKGGLYNIFLKSSGVKAKGGTSIVEDLIDYGEWVGDRKGLYVHYTPGYDHVLHARTLPERRAGGAVHHRPGHRHRLRSRAGNEDWLQPPARPRERRYRHRCGKNSREEGDHRGSWPGDFLRDYRSRFRAQHSARRGLRLPSRIQNLGIALADAVISGFGTRD